MQILEVKTRGVKMRGVKTPAVKTPAVAHFTHLPAGAMAEWLCSGLQIRVRRFDSGLRLQIQQGPQRCGPFSFSLLCGDFLTYPPRLSMQDSVNSRIGGQSPALRGALLFGPG